MGQLGGGTEIKIKCLLGAKESKSNVYWERKNQNRMPFKRRALSSFSAPFAALFWTPLGAVGSLPPAHSKFEFMVRFYFRKTRSSNFLSKKHKKESTSFFKDSLLVVMVCLGLIVFVVNFAWES